MFMHIACMAGPQTTYIMAALQQLDLWSAIFDPEINEDGENTERLIAIRYIVVKWYSSQALPITRY